MTGFSYSKVLVRGRRVNEATVLFANPSQLYFVWEERVSGQDRPVYQYNEQAFQLWWRRDETRDQSKRSFITRQVRNYLSQHSVSAEARSSIQINQKSGEVIVGDELLLRVRVTQGEVSWKWTEELVVQHGIQQDALQAHVAERVSK